MSETPFLKKLQETFITKPVLTVLPEYRKGEAATYAQRWVVMISEDSQKGGVYELYARLEALVFPIVLGGTLFQKALVSGEAIMNATIWYGGNHKSVREELKDLIFITGFIFYECVLIFFTVPYPKFLIREALKDPEPTSEQVEQKRALDAKDGDLATLKTTHGEEIKKKNDRIQELEKADRTKGQKHAQEVSDLKLEHEQALKKQKEKLEALVKDEEKKTSDANGECRKVKEESGKKDETILQLRAQANEQRGQLYNLLPIAPKSDEGMKHFNSQLQSFGVKGVEGHIFHYELKSNSPPDPSSSSQPSPKSAQKLPSTKTWGMAMNPKESEKALKVKAGDQYKAPFETLQGEKFKANGQAIPDIEEFLLPEGTSILRVDLNEINPDYIPILFNQIHQIDRLELLNVSEKSFSDLNKEGLLSKVHTLVLSGEKVAEETLNTIHKTYPNIACFDLRKITVEGETTDLKKVRIVLMHGFENARSMFDAFEEKVFNLVKGYTQKDAHKFVLAFPNSDSPEVLFHPVAPFVTNVSFLRGMPIRASRFEELSKRLKHSFPNMDTINLSKCERLTADSLKYIADLGLKKVYLRDCRMLRYRRIGGVDQKRDFLKVGENEWVSFDPTKLVMYPLAEKPSGDYTVRTTIDKTLKYYYTQSKSSELVYIEKVNALNKEEYFSVKDHQFQALPRYRCIKDADGVERFYRLSDQTLTHNLNNIFVNGATEVDLSLTVVDEESVNEVVTATIEETKVKFGEVILRYSTKEGEFLTYPEVKKEES